MAEVSAFIGFCTIAFLIFLLARALDRIEGKIDDLAALPAAEESRPQSGHAPKRPEND